MKNFKTETSVRPKVRSIAHPGRHLGYPFKQHPLTLLHLSFFLAFVDFNSFFSKGKNGIHCNADGLLKRFGIIITKWLA